MIVFVRRDVDRDTQLRLVARGCFEFSVRWPHVACRSLMAGSHLKVVDCADVAALDEWDEWLRYLSERDICTPVRHLVLADKASGENVVMVVGPNSNVAREVAAREGC